MAKRRNLGHISVHHAIKSSVVKFIDDNDITGSAAEVTAAWEQRLDYVEDQTDELNLKFHNVNAALISAVSDIDTNTTNITANADAVVSLDVYIGNINSDVAVNAQDIITINNELFTVDSEISSLSSSLDSAVNNITILSSSIDIVGTEVDYLSSSLNNVIGDISTINNEVTYLSSSLASLSASFTLLSASIGSGGNLNVNIPSDSELYFNGDTLMTDADVYISGSGNNLYLHGTNDQGVPAKFEFSVVSGSTYISEVSHSDFGEEIDDPWFKFDGDTLLTHADIYVSGSNNYLYLNGTDENGQYGIFYFDIIDGRVIVKQTGSIN